MKKHLEKYALFNFFHKHICKIGTTLAPTYRNVVTIDSDMFKALRTAAGIK